MVATYQDADGLFRNGDFAQLIRLAGRSGARHGYDLRTQMVVAHAYALTGHLKDAEELASAPSVEGAHPELRARACLILGIVKQARGDLARAQNHFRAAIRNANDARNPDQIAWAHLYLFRSLLEGHSMDALRALLSHVRTVVTRTGDPHVAAYLHISVSSLEGQTGRLSEALRHCDMADALLDRAPNQWLRGSVLLNRASIACLACEFDLAATLITAAREFTATSGHTNGIALLDSNSVYVDAMRGRYDKARETFQRIVSLPGSPAFAILGACESFARLLLAADDFQKCEEALRRLDEEAGRHPALRSIYQVRWSGITKARLLLKLRRPAEALECLDRLEHDSKSLRDVPFTAAIHLTSAVAYARMGQHNQAALRLLASDSLGITSSRELQAQYYYGGGLTIADASPQLTQLLKRRALRIWDAQGIVTVQKEMSPPEQISETIDPSTDNSSSGYEVASSLAAAFDLAHTPSLLGSEICEAIGLLGCAPDVRLEKRRPGSSAQRADERHRMALSLGVDNRMELVLVCDQPEDPAKAIVLADVLRIARAALALERARQEERSRAALWPASPVEEQAGALFLAEEMQTLLATARRIAPTTVPVLITGETGTGKEVLARMIHAYSTRARSTFLPFNCSATPKDMLDSQLFGHRRGAFTGASEHFAGVIRAAAGGTVFLDEIGETTLDVQPKLLRFLESNEVHPLGENQPVRVDVRVIAATNADLEALLAAGRFREDLFYRLNIVRLHVPPLRERRVEIPALANHYLRKHALENGKGDLRLAEETMEYLVLYRWPGNVRQLANEMRRLAALAEPGAVLMPEHLSADIAASRRTVPPSQRALDPNEVVVRMDQPMAAAVQHLERAMLQYALAQCNGRIEETAAMLGLSRKGLYLKRLRFGAERRGTPGAQTGAA